TEPFLTCWTALLAGSGTELGQTALLRRRRDEKGDGSDGARTGVAAMDGVAGRGRLCDGGCWTEKKEDERGLNAWREQRGLILR
ncbi:hypothetical protein PIB30_087812, partial [Stylosanthes scabra]|nr:hypothetical protein [Stylosanthes scabra]